MVEKKGQVGGGDVLKYVGNDGGRRWTGGERGVYRGEGG